MSTFEKSLHARAGTLLALLVAAPLVMTGLATAWSHDQGGNDDDDAAYDIGLWGDLPYTTATSRVQIDTGVPNLIADMNAHDLKFTAHDGDLRQGSGDPYCTDDLYTRSLAYFNSLKAPAMFTPGDNDWTDCDRAAPAGDVFSALERLEKERAIFFSTPHPLGQQGKRILQEVQTEPLCLGLNKVTGARTNVACVENRRWVVGRVTYATIDIQGTCNNRCPSDANGTDADDAEYQARNLAAIKWMQETFAKAKQNKSVAVMFITQADPGFDTTGGQGEPRRDPVTLIENDGNPDGFGDFLRALRDEVVAFKKPVAYVHGDSHYFRIDQPFRSTLGRLENFTRLETFGDNAANGNNDVRWVKVHVDPKSRDVFSYQPITVPANRTAVPAPTPDQQHDAHSGDWGHDQGQGPGGHR